MKITLQQAAGNALAIAVQGVKIKAPDMSLRAIIWAAHQYHPAYSGTICAATGVGALIPGTVVNEVLADEAKKTGETKIGHPLGIVTIADFLP